MAGMGTTSHTCGFTHAIAYFQKACKAIFLLGVHQPFWRNWAYTDPFIFLILKVLHTLHKFFFDHPLSWCKEVVGNDKLDAHYKVHHKHIGMCHFTSGISHMKQMTGHNHHDIQHTIVPMITGVALEEVVCMIHALVNFIYHAQRPMHMEASIQHMENSGNCMGITYPHGLWVWVPCGYG
jgi:hypothetical protein